MTLPQYFLSMVSIGPEDECWLWPHRIQTKWSGYGGYGLLSWGGETLYAHRVAYEVFKGIPPTGQEVLHSCDTPPCWNPAHLFVGTHQANMADAAKKGRLPRKLTKQAVAVIRSSNATLTALARHYGVSLQCVAAARNRKTWRHA